MCTPTKSGFNNNFRLDTKVENEARPNRSHSVEGA